MKRTWLGLLLAVAVAWGVGFSGTGRKAQAVNQAEIFQAVASFLTEARVPRQDMPKAVIAVTPLKNGHFLVHMQMVEGEGWFEVWKEGGRWKVQGAPPPR